jgi:hypothetical protein
MGLENRSIPSDYGSQHLPPLYTHKHPGRRSHSIHICNISHSTLQQPNNMEPMKRIAVCGNWDLLPEEIVTLITVMVAETLEAPLKDLRSLWLCIKATKRLSLSHAIANRFNSFGGCQRARRIPTNRRLLARCKQWRSPLRQGDGRHLHGPPSGVALLA